MWEIPQVNLEVSLCQQLLNLMMQKWIQKNV